LPPGRDELPLNNPIERRKRPEASDHEGPSGLSTPREPASESGSSSGSDKGGVPHPLPNVTNSPPKRASSESAESETTKKARLDSANTSPSSRENSRPFSGTGTRPGSSKVSDYNEKAKFTEIFGPPDIPDRPTVPSHPTTAGKAPKLPPAHNLAVTHVGAGRAAETGAAAGARRTGLGGRELEAAFAVEVATESNAAEVMETKQARYEQESVCRVCQLGDRDDVLLICDGCNDMYHTTCVGLTDVPPGHWFCQICQEIQASRPPVPAIQPAQPAQSNQPAQPRSSVALAEPAGDDSSQADKLNAPVLGTSTIYLSD
jgi:hypothetical protein